MRHVSRILIALLLITVTASSTALANHGTEAGDAVKWIRSTDDPGTGARMNVPIEGSSGFSGWFKHSSPAISNIDGDPTPEIIIGSLDGRLYIWDQNGTRQFQGYLGQPINGSPAVGDIDGNGTNEIVVGTDGGHVFALYGNGAIVPGWPQFTGFNGDYPNNCATNACTGVWAGPTLADLDGDGTLEIIVGSFSHLMYVYRHDGSVMPGWPRDVNDGIPSSAAVGDLDNDGSPDIVVGSDMGFAFGPHQPGGLMHAYRVDGTELPGWPQPTDSFMPSSPALADLDGDGSLEVVSGGGFFTSNSTDGSETRGHHVYAWRSNGSLYWRFEAQGVVNGSPAVADITGDGRPEIAFGSVGYRRPNGQVLEGKLYLLNYNGFQAWSTLGITPGGPAGSGAYFSMPVLGDVTGDGVPEVVAADANFRVKAYTIAGALVMDRGTNYSMYNAPAIGDTDGDGKNEVVVGSLEGGPGSFENRRGQVWVLDTNGIGGLAWPQFHSRVRSGDGFLAYSSGFRGGVRVAVGNFTDDPGDEIATAPGPGGGPHIRVWSIVGGRPRIVSQWFAYDAGFTGGVFVGTANTDGSGRDELVTAPGRSGGPHIRVWNAASPGAPLTQWFAYDAGFFGGVAVAGGNVAGSAAEEVITGPGPGGGPHVRVWNGAAPGATPLAQWFAYDPGFYGGVFVASGDTSAPAAKEVIVGAGAGGGPHAKIFSIATGSSVVQQSWFPYDLGFTGGVRLAVNEAANPDQVVTAPGPGGGPHVKCFSGLSVACSFFPFGLGISNGLYAAHGQIDGGPAHVLSLDQGALPAVRIRP